MDAALHKNEAELGVLVLAVAVKMLTHGHGLLDQAIHVLRQRWGQTRCLQDAEDLGARDGANLGHAEAVAESDTDLGGRETLLCEL